MILYTVAGWWLLSSINYLKLECSSFLSTVIFISYFLITIPYLTLSLFLFLRLKCCVDCRLSTDREYIGSRQQQQHLNNGNRIRMRFWRSPAIHSIKPRTPNNNSSRQFNQQNSTNTLPSSFDSRLGPSNVTGTWSSKNQWNVRTVHFIIDTPLHPHSISSKATD